MTRVRNTVDGINQCTLLPVGSIGFLVDFEFYMAVWGSRRCPMEFLAHWRFKWLDSQPVESEMGPIPINFHEFRLFQKSCHGFLAHYLSCFRANRPEVGFSSFWVGTKKMRDEKLHRFVVVSPREVPSLTFSCPFKISEFRSFLKVPHSPSPFHAPATRKKCTLLVSVNRSEHKSPCTSRIICEFAAHSLCFVQLCMSLLATFGTIRL